MNVQQRLLKSVVRFNWFFLISSNVLAFVLSEPSFAMGVFFGGLITTVNFYLLYRTLKVAFRPNNLGSYNIVLLKYYVRFIVSALIILLLIWRELVNPLGLFVGLSVVVASIIVATALELKKLIFEEAI